MIEQPFTITRGSINRCDFCTQHNTKTKEGTKYYRQLGYVLFLGPKSFFICYQCYWHRFMAEIRKIEKEEK